LSEQDSNCPGNKSKNWQMGLHRIKRLLRTHHRKQLPEWRQNPQNRSKIFASSSTDNQNIQRAQKTEHQKNKWPNYYMSRLMEGTVLRRSTNG
jgi:hypothetical protein